jgi:hypothetical protein
LTTDERHKPSEHHGTFMKDIGVTLLPHKPYSESSEAITTIEPIVPIMKVHYE